MITILTLKEAKSYIEKAYSIGSTISVTTFIDPEELPCISISSQLKDVKIVDCDEWGLSLEIKLKNDSIVDFYENYYTFELDESNELLFIFSQNLKYVNHMVHIKSEE